MDSMTGCADCNRRQLREITVHRKIRKDSTTGTRVKKGKSKIMGTYSKKYKRKLSVLSVLTAAIFLLTGCGQSEETVYQIPEDKKLIVYTAH